MKFNEYYLKILYLFIILSIFQNKDEIMKKKILDDTF